MTDVLPGRRERKKEETKRKIFEAATKLFAHKGFEATTIDEIAAEADVSKGTFFNYFPKKEAIIRYLFEEWTEIAEGIVADREHSATTRIVEMFAAGAASFGEKPELARTVARFALQEMCSPAPEMVDTHRQHHLLFDEVWKQGVESGEFRGDVDIVWVRSVFGAVFVGSVTWWVGCADCVVQYDPLSLPLPEVIRNNLRVILEGLAARKVA
jgi:AcrR family transcriptional regulator